MYPVFYFPPYMYLKIISLQQVRSPFKKTLSLLKCVELTVRIGQSNKNETGDVLRVPGVVLRARASTEARR